MAGCLSDAGCGSDANTDANTFGGGGVRGASSVTDSASSALAIIDASTFTSTLRAVMELLGAGGSISIAVGSKASLANNGAASACPLAELRSDEL
jgi:hypothetical protein